MNHSQRWFICFALVVMVCIGLSCGFLGAGPEVFLVKDSENSFHFQWSELLLEDRIILTRAVYSNRLNEFHDTVRLSSEEPARDIPFSETIHKTIHKIEYRDHWAYYDVYGGYSVDEGLVLKEILSSVFNSLEFTHKRYEEAGVIRYQIEIVNPPVPSDFSDFSVDRLDYTVEVDYAVTNSLDDSSEDQLVLFRAGTVQSDRVFLSRIFDPPFGSGTCTITIRPAEERKNVELPEKAYDPDNRDYEEILSGYPLQPYDVGNPSELVLNYTTED